MDIKTAWALKSGDLIVMAGGFEEIIGRATKMVWTGEFEGRQYRQAPMVKVELASVPGAFFLAPGDKVFNVVNRGQGAKA